MYQIKRGDEVIKNGDDIQHLANALFFISLEDELINISLFDHGYLELINAILEAGITKPYMNKEIIFHNHLIPIAAKYGLTIQDVKE